MNAKWYFSTLIIILTFLGIRQQETSVANQEIVMEFIDDEVTSCEIQDAIAIVKTQLEALGVDDIEVRKEEDGRLRITYYSDVNVESIKRLLSEEKNIALGYTSYDREQEDSKFPSKEKTNSYNLDVYEIHKGTDIQFGLDGKYVIDLNHDYDRFTNPNVPISLGLIDASENNSLVKIAYKLYRNIAIAIDNTSHKIPEVRAGPIT